MSDNEISIRVTGKDDSASKTFEKVEKSSKDMAGGLDRAGEAADGAEGKAQGFSDTLTGTSDIMSGAGQIASGDLYGGLVTAGMGVADLAGGMASFLIPALKNMSLGAVKAKAATLAHAAATKATAAAQWVLNAALSANPIGLVIVAIVALVAVLVIAYKKSETFRNIVDASFRAVQRAAAAAFGWIKSNWPLLLAIITGPIGLAVLVIARNKDRIIGLFRAIPGAIGGAFRTLSGAITAPFSSAFSAIRSLWNSTIGGFGFSIPGWVPKVGGKSFHIPEMAHGGIGGGLMMVGERGRELVRLPQGSQVIPNGSTEAMLSRGGGGGGGQPIVLQLVLDSKVVWEGQKRLFRTSSGAMGVA